MLCFRLTIINSIKCRFNPVNRSFCLNADVVIIVSFQNFFVWDERQILFGRDLLLLSDKFVVPCSVSFVKKCVIFVTFVDKHVVHQNFEV